MYWIIRLPGIRSLHAKWQVRRLFGAGGIPGDRASSLLDAARSRELVFVVSYHKCATRSTDAVLRDLGYRHIHWPIWIHCGIDFLQILNPVCADRELCVRALSPLFGWYEAFSDVPFPGLYRELSARFPKSRFILVTREAASWWGSISRHWGLSRGPHTLDSFEAVQFGMPRGKRVSSADEGTLCQAMLRHNEDVRAFFGDTGRLFVCPLGDKELGGKMAAFLGKRLPEGYVMPRLSEANTGR